MQKQYDIGILGGGQLGAMLIQAAKPYGLRIKVMDNDPRAPCSALADTFVCASLLDEDSVYDFGYDCYALTLEIEAVNALALQRLEGDVLILPSFVLVQRLQNKLEQKRFFVAHKFKSAVFYDNIQEAKDYAAYERFFPCIEKHALGGYDGKGVQKLASVDEAISLGWHKDAFIEEEIAIQKELAVVLARDTQGIIEVFDCTGMAFHPKGYLLKKLHCPAHIADHLANQTITTAKNIARRLNYIGVLAIEFFLSKDNILYVNELAPRVHNSGHHSIEAYNVSQFEQHIRLLLQKPLQKPRLRAPAILLNILGAPHQEGVPRYDDLLSLKEPNVFVHLYNKVNTKPYRKLGHITVMASSFSKKAIDYMQDSAKDLEALIWVQSQNKLN